MSCPSGEESERLQWCAMSKLFFLVSCQTSQLSIITQNCRLAFVLLDLDEVINIIYY